MSVDLGLGSVFGRSGADTATNSVNPAEVTAQVEMHDFRVDAMPKTPRPIPPPPWPTQQPAMPAPLFTAPGAVPPQQQYGYEQRERELRQYAEQVGKHEVDRGFSFGVAVERQRHADAIRAAELDRDLAHQRATFAQQHPATLGGAVGSAVVPWVPTLLHDPLVRLIFVGGLIYCIWAFGQRLLPASMREK